MRLRWLTYYTYEQDWNTHIGRSVEHKRLQYQEPPDPEWKDVPVVLVQHPQGDQDGKR